MTKTTVTWGLIGCGDVTEIKSGPGLYKATGSKLAAVYNRTYDKAVDYAKRHNIVKVYKSAAELVADPEIDIVYIATPPVSHTELAALCLNAGKIPYIEKPVANSYNECLQIKKLAEEKGLPVYAAFYRRGVEKFLKIKELLDNKAIGDIRYIQIVQTTGIAQDELDPQNLPWRVIPEISGGGKFLDMAVHILDTLAMFFGEYAELQGTVSNNGGYYPADDTVVATFTFKCGITGSGSWCYVADKDTNEVQIIGSRGRICYDGLSAKSFTLEQDGEVETFSFTVPEHASMPYQQAIVDELLGKQQSKANFNQSINIVEMTDMLYNKYRGGENVQSTICGDEG